MRNLYLLKIEIQVNSLRLRFSIVLFIIKNYVIDNVIDKQLLIEKNLY